MKAKIIIEEIRILGTHAHWSVRVEVDGDTLLDTSIYDTKKAAREWAKEWCRTAGQALMEKGK